MRRAGNRKVAALLYHYVGPEQSSACRGLTVTPQAFSRQMGALAALGWRGVAARDWAGYVRGRNELARNSFIITFDDAYSDIAEHALPVLAKYGFSATVFVPTSLVGKTLSCLPDHEEATLPVMGAPAILEWAGKGFEFGAHSRIHSDLTMLEPSAAEAEITGSIDDLATILGATVTAFAYPFGKVSQSIEAIVAARCETAFGIEEGINDAGASMHNLRRTMVQHADSVADVCLRARYGMSVLEKVRTTVSRTLAG